MAKTEQSFVEYETRDHLACAFGQIIFVYCPLLHLCYKNIWWWITGCVNTAMQPASKTVKFAKI